MKTIFALTLVFSSGLLGNPQGFSLKGGEASCASAQSTLTVQTGDRAVIHWDSFSIGAHETTRFAMPSSSSAILNRVVGGNASEILGTLQANGQVYLLNPKGILFGENAVVNTASFFASTLDVLDSSFLKGGDLTFFGDSVASIVNLGKLSAKEGSITLIAYHIENKGSLSAPRGDVLISSGGDFILQPGEGAKVLIRANFAENNDSIDQQGKIEALRTELHSSGNPHQLAIRDGGSINALVLQEEGGKIYLVADEGKIETRGTYTAESGTVVVMGKEVWLKENSAIDVSGKNGGHIAIGDPHASQYTYVGPGVSLKANSLLDGNGGEVVLWSDKGTAFFGSISAEGGLQGGSGGFVEISSHGSLLPQGTVSTKAPMGKIGRLLFDPCQVTISTGADANINTTPPPDYTFGAGATATINNTLLAGFLMGNSVTINATTGGGGAGAGTEFIHVDAPVMWTPATPTTLTLTTTTAGSEIQINESIYMQQVGFMATNDVIVVQSPQITIGSVGSATNCELRAASGSIKIPSGSGALTIQGGSGAASESRILIDSTGDIDIELTGALTMTGGSGNDSRAIIQGGTSSAVTINANSVLMTGGSSAMPGGSDVIISTTSQPLMITTAGNVTLQASSTTSQNTRIESTSANININCVDLNILGAAAATGNNTSSIITQSGNGSLNITSTGSVNLTGGDATNSGAIINIGNGGCTVTMSTGLFLTATATPAANGAGARITTQNFLTVNGAGPITLQGGASTNARAEMACTKGPLTVGNVTQPSMVTLSGGTGTDSDAQIATFDPAGTIQMNVVGNYTLTGGSGGGAPFASIYSDSAPINLFGAGMMLQGTASQGVAQVQTGSGTITVQMSNDITCQGGAQPNSVANFSTLVSGDIDITCNNFSATGGMGNGANAGALTQSGDIVINCAGDCTLQGMLGAPSLGEVRTFGSDLTIMANGSVSLIGNTILSVPAPTGDLLVIAGVDINVDTASQIIANGSGSITLVVDNLFPMAPGIGPGIFNFNNGTIQAIGGGPLRIFTATQPQNMIVGSLNGQVYVMGTEFANTNQERWGTYYFNAFFGGPGYTIFYKNGTAPSPVIIPTSTLVAGAVEAVFLDSELFFDLSDYDYFFFDDYFNWSNFNIGYDRLAFKKAKGTLQGFEVIDDKGLSIRQRKGYNKITPSRGL